MNSLQAETALRRAEVVEGTALSSQVVTTQHLIAEEELHLSLAETAHIDVANMCGRSHQHGSSSLAMFPCLANILAPPQRADLQHHIISLKWGRACQGFALSHSLH